MRLIVVAAAVVSVTSIYHPRQLVHPPWDLPVPRHGHVCIDASTDHAPKKENNTRMSFWALPDERSPPSGFPVYVEMKAEIFSAGDWRHPSETPQCGNGWVPPSGFRFLAA